MRATNAAGLLSAAAAATLAAFILRNPTTGGVWTRNALTVAAAAYVLSVVAYLIGATWGSPKQDEDVTDVKDKIIDYCEYEARPIRRAVRAGTILGSVAILSTGLALGTIAMTTSYSAIVAFREAEEFDAVRRACPAVDSPFKAQVERINESRAALHVPRSLCGNRQARIEVPYDAITIVTATGD